MSTLLVALLLGLSGLAGLNRSCHAAELHYVDTAGSPPAIVHRYEYAYDIAGNRRYTYVTQADDATGTPHANDRSYKYGYDTLQRLTAADFGALNATNQAIANDPTIPLRRSHFWLLDNLG